MTGLFLKLPGIRRPGIVAIVGSGGKTSLMFRMASEAAQAGWRVVTTTTTKIFYPTTDQTPLVLLAPDNHDTIRRLDAALGCHGHVTLIRERLSANKAAGPSAEMVDAIMAAGIADLILVEADGARRLPLKAPGQLEPVIPSSTQLIVAVAGLSGLGRPLDENHVFRSERFAELSGISIGQPITVEGLARVMVHPEGHFRTAPTDALKAVFLNQSDLLEPARAAQCARIVQEAGGPGLAWTAWGSILNSTYSVLT